MKSSTHFALVYSQFKALLDTKDPPVRHAYAIFETFDGDRNGRIDALEFFGGLAIVCNAEVDDTARCKDIILIEMEIIIGI